MSRLPYYGPPDSNQHLEAERVTDPDNPALPADRQRVADPVGQARLAEIRDRVATEVTLAAVLAAVDAVEPLLTAIRDNQGDDPTETTLAALRTDVAKEATLATITKEATLAAVRDRIGAVADPATADTMIGLLKRLNAEDFSSEATLAALRGDVAKENTLAAANALLTTIRDEQQRRTDPLAAGANMIGFVAPSVAQVVGQGRFFLSSSGRMALGIVGGNLRFTFTNPAGSGKNATLVRIAGFSSAGNGFAEIMLNPTTGVPTTTPRPYMNAIAGGGLPAVSQVRTDLSSTAMAGGISTGIIIGVPQNSRFSIDLPPIVAAPGVTVGVNIPYTGTGDVTFSVYWYE